MELNGVANLKLLMDELTKDLPNYDRLTVPTAQIYKQLDLLERYMLEYGRVVDLMEKQQVPAGVFPMWHAVPAGPLPMWHEVRENPSLYPTNTERDNGLKSKK